jgi:hypothetical protein
VSVANSALKATFGGQLSDGERKALANEFYNDKLSNAENLKIIERKISELEGGLETQQRKANYFENNRSLAGFEGLKRLSDSPNQTEGTKQPPGKNVVDQIGSALSSKANAANQTPIPPKHPQDDSAVQWAMKNKKDPRAQQILKANGY